ETGQSVDTKNRTFAAPAGSSGRRIAPSIARISTGPPMSARAYVQSARKEIRRRSLYVREVGRDTDEEQDRDQRTDSGAKSPEHSFSTGVRRGEPQAPYPGGAAPKPLMG